MFGTKWSVDLDPFILQNFMAKVHDKITVSRQLYVYSGDRELIPLSNHCHLLALDKQCFVTDSTKENAL